MPANRSRTEHWRDNLQKVVERGGSLELAIASPASGGTAPSDSAGTDVVWRVKLLEMRHDALVVEQPAAFGSTFKLLPNIALIGAMTIGQNRWMFHTRTLGGTSAPTGGQPTLLLAPPDRVERCTRRSFYRISTASVRLPRVQCWPLLNPASVGPAEAANRTLLRDLINANSGPIVDRAEDLRPDSLLLPEVGPMFQAQLLNISGGGMGLVVDRSDMQVATSKPFWWMRVDLRPDIPAPIAVSARLAHTHIDSTQALYCGVAFEFGHDASQRDFVVSLFARFTDELQRRQIRQAVA